MISRSLSCLCFALGTLSSTSAVASEFDVESLLYDRPEVTSPGAAGPIALTVEIDKAIAGGASVSVSLADGYKAEWKGSPGHHARFGYHGAVEATITVHTSTGDLTQAETLKLTGKDAETGATCAFTVRASASSLKLAGGCEKNPPPIQLTEAACGAPASSPLEMLSTRLGCMAYRFEVGSTLALESRGDLADALGLKADADTVRTSLTNLTATEDVLERQVLRARAISDEGVVGRIEETAAQLTSVNADLRGAIDRAEAKRKLASKEVSLVGVEIAELTLYFANLVVQIVQDPIHVGIPLIAEGLRINYLQNVVVPITKAMKASTEKYRTLDARMDEIMAKIVAVPDAPAAPKADAPAATTASSDSF